MNPLDGAHGLYIFHDLTLEEKMWSSLWSDAVDP